MLEKYFQSPFTLEQLRNGPSGSLLGGFAGSLHEDGYSWLTARSYLRAAHHLGHFLRSEGIALVAVQPDTINVFRRHLDDCRCPKPRGRKTEDTIRGAKCFLRHLWIAGVVAQPVKQPWPPLVQGFQSVDHLEAIVLIALGELGLVDVEAAWLQAERDKLVRAAAGAPAILEMTYRHAITGENAFSMLPGFASFEPVTAGQTVAVDARGDVTAPKGGYLLMPLYQKQGDDGFFIVTKVRSFWFWLSALLRYARAGRIAHWLPGVSRVEGERHRVRVRRAIARWYSLELLHLLGFRRLAEEGDMLLMERRAHDLP